MVSIAAFQAVDPGSIPGRRNFFPLIIQMSVELARNLFSEGSIIVPHAQPNLDTKKNIFLHAVTRIRTWVTAATTQGPNH